MPVQQKKYAQQKPRPDLDVGALWAGFLTMLACVFVTFIFTAGPLAANGHLTGPPPVATRVTAFVLGLVTAFVVGLVTALRARTAGTFHALVLGVFMAAVGITYQVVTAQVTTAGMASVLLSVPLTALGGRLAVSGSRG